MRGGRCTPSTRRPSGSCSPTVPPLVAGLELSLDIFSCRPAYRPPARPPDVRPCGPLKRRWGSPKATAVRVAENA